MLWEVEVKNDQEINACQVYGEEEKIMEEISRKL